MRRLRRADLETALALVGVACELEGPDPFPAPYLAELQRVTHASSVGYCFLTRRRARYLDVAFVPDEEEDPELDLRYWETIHTCPTFNHRDGTGDQRALRLSDVVSRRAYHALPIYQECFRPSGVEHGLEVALPAPAGTDRFLIFWRPPEDRDFSHCQRDLLEVLRPHFGRMVELAELRQHAVAASPASSAARASLTDREAEVLDLVARGRTNAEIASVLSVQPSTIKKHLENIYDKLGVANRAAAVARASRAAGRQ